MKPREEVLEPVLEEGGPGTAPFRPSWVYGYNPRLPVHNLCTLAESTLAFADNHLIVLLDIKKRGFSLSLNWYYC